MLIFWILVFDAAICSVIGFFVGDSRDRPGLGAFLGFVLGPIGLLAILLLGESSRIAADRRVHNTAVWAHADAPRVTEPMPGRPPVGMVRILHQGRELGPLAMDRARMMLATGELSGADFFFEPDRRDWLPLRTHPELSEERKSSDQGDWKATSVRES
jgi:hypothetical protein